MSTHTYSRDDVDVRTLGKEVKAALLGKSFRLRMSADVVFEFADELLVDDVVALDGAVATHKAASGERALAAAKAAKVAAVDAKTSECIFAGYVHNGRTFSLSHTAQKNMSELHENRGALSYPLQMSVADNSEVYPIADAAELETMYQAALTSVLTQYGTGNALKADVVAAVDVAAVDAVEDPR